ELVTRIKQPIGLESWGRIRVNYRDVNSESPFVIRQANRMGVPASDLADGICALLDVMRRQNYLLFDHEFSMFTRYWADGDREIQRGYFPRMPGVPKGLKLRRSPGDENTRVYQWAADGGHLTLAREIVRSWGVDPEETDTFLEELWDFLVNEIKVLTPVTLRGQKGNALPRCAGTHQIDVDKMLIAPIRELYRCKKCQRAQVRKTPHNRCTGWHCDGELVFEPENPDSYDLQLLDQGIEMIRPKEHSAQVPAEERERIEYLFKGDSDAVNTLVCTPTLELGVDIGQLDTVLLRNVPPLPANYWQRVGRAGRRHRMAVNMTYSRPVSHDQVYFSEPLKLLEGKVDPPRFNLKNDLLVQKHVHASILTRLHHLGRESSGLSEFDRNEINETLSRIFPIQIRDYLFDEDGNLLSTSFDVSPLKSLLTKHQTDLVNWIQSTFTQWWPEKDSSVIDIGILNGYVVNAAEQLNTIIERFRKRLNWALRQMERLDQERRRRGTLDLAEDALYRRCDKIIKILKGQITRRRSQAEGYDDTNTFAALALEGYLPGYGLDIGSILGTAQMPRYLGLQDDFDLRRPTVLALREYVPGNLIYANGQRFFPRYFHLEPEDPVYFQLDTAHGAVREIGLSTTGPEENTAAIQGIATEELRAVPMCDVDLPHFSHISDEEEFRFQMSVATFGYEKGQPSGGLAYKWGSNSVLHRRGVHFRLLNAGVRRLIETAEPKLGYPVCLVCGQSRSPFASERELEHFYADHAERCGKQVEATGFYADVVADSISLPDCESREAAYSVLEAIRTGASQVIEMETEDLEILVIGRPGSETVNGMLFDPMPGGSGLLDQICEHFSEVVTTANNLVEHCPSACSRACVDCLMRFRNAFFHAHLNRNLAAECFQQWGDSINVEHEIPPLHPQQPVGDTGMTVNDAEATLRRMLLNAGFPEGEWQRQINLGRPLGTTTPDCYFEDEEPEEPGICIYLDGLSEHIHGNAETRAKDQQIREQLRVQGYEVIEIAASDLYDRDRMARHLSRIAKLLIGRDEARRIRDNLDWFEDQETSDAQPDDIVPFKRIDPSEADKYKTCVPLMTLKAAAGGFGESMEVDAQEWVLPTTNRKLEPGMFLAQVIGHSMEPRIPGGVYCLFKAPVVGSRTGRIVLVEHRDIHDPESGGSYTVKQFDSSQIEGKDSTERVGTIYLRPLNPEFGPIVLTDISENEVKVVAELIEVLNK
ncbi:MAG: helicase-related protein, partial [bacterium]